MTELEVTKLILSNPPQKPKDPDLPTVSFLMPTYGMCARKPQLLDEAVYWFTRQTWPNVELVILNDAPGQLLECPTPGVRVFNWPHRFNNFGDKRNMLTLLASGQVCCPWDDDDISLPNRAEVSTSQLEGYDWWAPKEWFYCERGKEPERSGNGWAFFCVAFRRDSFLGRHPRVNKFEDRDAQMYASKHLRCNTGLYPYRPTYCYRWGYHPNHWSGFPDMNDAYDKNDAGRSGKFAITPNALDDWVSLTSRA